LGEHKLYFSIRTVIDHAFICISTNIRQLILCTVALVLLTIRQSAAADADDVLAFRKYEGVKVYYKDSLVTSADKKYIGNTTNYVFVHDIKKNVTEVYKLNDIMKIDFDKWNGRDFSDTVVQKNLQTIGPK
jgi:hypothetical protein